MFNKRVGTLLALVLASAMALSGPAAVLASSGDSVETGQTETTDTKEEKEDEKDKEESIDADAEKDKKAKAKKNEKNTDGDDESLDSADKAKDKDLTEEAQEKTLPEADASEEDKAEEKEEESLPRAGASENKTGPFTVSGADASYSYDGNILVISKNTALRISGYVSQGSIRVDSQEGANLTFDDLHINTSGTALEVASGTTGAVRIHLSGQNKLSGIAISNNGRVTVEGPGVLKSDAGQVSVQSSSRPVVISGGNIQASFRPTPVNEGSALLYPVSINGLSEDREYSIKSLKVKGVSGNYSYGNAINTDEKGKIVMYLPEGDAQLQLAYGSTNYNYQGTVLSGNNSELKRVQPLNTPTALPSPSPSDSPTPPVTATPTTPGRVSGNQANPADNGLYWINEGATYRSGANLQFYATGAGYGPEEPQQVHPVKNSTRYVPVSWSVASTSTGNNGKASGSWEKKHKETTTGRLVSGNYVPGEYQFKASFVLSTNTASSVPYTLAVNYQKETYNGKKWVADGNASVTKSVNFYIRNVSANTGTPRASGTPYGSRVTTTAARTGVSSNARNARTSDDTPIGTMIFLLFAAAGSGAVVFRKKMRS